MTRDPRDYVGKKVYPRAGTRAKRPGRVVGIRGCAMEGCMGTRLITRWPDGKYTYPCARGMKMTPAGNWKIL